jgi:hypothetical protein
LARRGEKVHAQTFGNGSKRGVGKEGSALGSSFQSLGQTESDGMLGNTKGGLESFQLAEHARQQKRVFLDDLR